MVGGERSPLHVCRYHIRKYKSFHHSDKALKTYLERPHLMLRSWTMNLHRTCQVYISMLESLWEIHKLQIWNEDETLLSLRLLWHVWPNLVVWRNHCAMLSIWLLRSSWVNACCAFAAAAAFVCVYLSGFKVRLFYSVLCSLTCAPMMTWD